MSIARRFAPCSAENSRESMIDTVLPRIGLRSHSRAKKESMISVVGSHLARNVIGSFLSISP